MSTWGFTFDWSSCWSIYLSGRCTSITPTTARSRRQRPGLQNRFGLKFINDDVKSMDLLCTDSPQQFYSSNITNDDYNTVFSKQQLPAHFHNVASGQKYFRSSQRAQHGIKYKIHLGTFKSKFQVKQSKTINKIRKQLSYFLKIITAAELQDYDLI